MNGLIIVEQPCPLCANRRMARLGQSGQLVCFNCRGQWTDDCAFTENELRRLRIYRAAVDAGFFSDWRGCE